MPAVTAEQIIAGIKIYKEVRKAVKKLRDGETYNVTPEPNADLKGASGADVVAALKQRFPKNHFLWLSKGPKQKPEEVKPQADEPPADNPPPEKEKE
jgi:hypothetical protein